MRNIERKLIKWILSEKLRHHIPKRPTHMLCLDSVYIHSTFVCCDVLDTLKIYCSNDCVEKFLEHIKDEVILKAAEWTVFTIANDRAYKWVEKRARNSRKILDLFQRVQWPRTFFEEYSIRFLIVCKLINLALVVLKFLMFKVCGIIGISKIEFFNFSGTERVNNKYHTGLDF